MFPLQGGANSKYEARNFFLALLNGIFIHIGALFIDSGTVLAAFVKQLTRSNMMVGLVSSTMRAGWMWPQLIMSNLLEHRPRKMPFYTIGVTMRIIAWIIILLLMIFIGNHNHFSLFFSFYVLYFVACSSMGVSTIPFNDIVAKTIPVRKRARLFSLRQFIGGIFGIVAGFLIRYILSEDFFLSFPHNYTAMFGFAVAMITLSSISFILIIEPIHPVQKKRQPFWQHLKRGPHFLKTDRDYRYFMAFRIISSFGNMCIPFYVPYALDRIGVAASAVGIFTAAGETSAVLSNILWAYMGERRGSRSLLIATSFLACVAPVIAACIRYLPPSTQAASYSLVFIVTQAYISGSNIAYMTYNLNMAPSISRLIYIGFLNTLIFPLSFVPVLAGALLKIMSYEWMFILSVGMSAIAVFFAVRLSNVEKRGDIESKEIL